VEVFRVGEQMKHLRRGAALLGAGEETIDLARLRIGLGSVGEREQVDRKQDVEVLERVARRLAETMIERSAARATDLIEDAVEHAPPLFVFVKALMETVAQKPSPSRHG